MMNIEEARLAYALRLGDNALVLGQRLIELVAHHPELEEELANANISLDFLGQARMFYSYAGELEGLGRTEDDFAYRRDSKEFRNVLLLELPNGDFGDTIVRQVLFDSFYVLQLEALVRCNDSRLAEIAARAVKEVRYHLRHVSQWLIRLGDGTEESHDRVGKALQNLWPYSAELFAGDAVDDCLRDACDGPDLGAIEKTWRSNIAGLLREATLAQPQDQPTEAGGRQGQHTEHMSVLLTEMHEVEQQIPEASW